MGPLRIYFLTKTIPKETCLGIKMFYLRIFGRGDINIPKLRGNGGELTMWVYWVGRDGTKFNKVVATTYVTHHYYSYLAWSSLNMPSWPWPSCRSWSKVAIKLVWDIGVGSVPVQLWINGMICKWCRVVNSRCDRRT